MKQFFLTVCGVSLFAAACLAAGGAADPASEVVWQYVQARVQQDRMPYSVDVTISGTIPSLKKSGTLRATRRQSQGQFQYESVNFEGDSLIKTNVIARYLTAEIEAQKPEEKLATQISLANYEFKLKGRENVEGRDALVFEVKPRQKRAGLFRGHVWIDTETRQPLMETGKLAKLPSVWVKEINFTRQYTMADGLAVPSRIVSEVNTRIIGKANITIDFENYRFAPPDAIASVSSEQ